MMSYPGWVPFYCLRKVIYLCLVSVNVCKTRMLEVMIQFIMNIMLQGNHYFYMYIVYFVFFIAFYLYIFYGPLSAKWFKMCLFIRFLNIYSYSNQLQETKKSQKKERRVKEASLYNQYEWHIDFSGMHYDMWGLSPVCDLHSEVSP